MNTMPNRSSRSPFLRAARNLAGACLLTLGATAWASETPCPAPAATRLVADTSTAIERSVATSIAALARARWASAQENFARDTDARVATRTADIAAQVAEARRERLEARMYTRIALGGESPPSTAQLATPGRAAATASTVWDSPAAAVATARIDCGPPRQGPALEPPGSFR